MAGVISTLAGVLAEVLWLGYRTGGVRVRETAFCWLARHVLLQAEIDLFLYLPGGLSGYVEASHTGPGSSVLLLAWAANVAVVLALAGAVMLAIRRRWKGRDGRGLDSRATALLGLAPSVLHIASDVSSDLMGRRIWGALLGVGCLTVVFVLSRRFRMPAGSALVHGIWMMPALAAAAAWLGQSGSPEPSPAREGAPNVLLISVDSLRRDHLHTYGYARQTSPVLDQLAAEGAVFETVVSPSSWTLPAHMTMLTALPPEAHQANDIGTRLGRGVMTLAEAFHERGYATAGFGVGPLLQAEYGFHRGFDHYDDYSIHGGFPRHPHWGETSSKSIARCLNWLYERREKTSGPFFVFLHLWDVHFDYRPPPPHGEEFDPGYEGPITGSDVASSDLIQAGMPSADLEHLIALYDGEIRHTDAQIGRLLEVLRTKGELDQTLVVVTADHGEEFFEHGRKLHGQTLYDEVVLVPLVLRLPGQVPAGAKVTEQVRLMDLPLTILRLAGLEPPKDFGLVPGLRPRPARDLTPRLEPESGRLETPPAYGELRGGRFFIRTPEWKFIRGAGSKDAAELYWLTKDPSESLNLDGVADRETRMGLEQALTAWRTAVSSDRGDAQPPDQAQLDALRSLGYIQ